MKHSIKVIDRNEMSEFDLASKISDIVEVITYSTVVVEVVAVEVK